MGDTYNNVGATGLVARSNHYCPVIMGTILFVGDWVVMKRVFVECALVEQTTVIGPSVIGPTVIGSGVVGPTVVGPGDQTGRPYIRGVDIIELRFDKMSNEGVYNVLPRTKIRFGGFGGPSRAIRKIQIDADRGVGTTFRRVLGTDGCPFSVFGS